MPLSSPDLYYAWHNQHACSLEIPLFSNLTYDVHVTKHSFCKKEVVNWQRQSLFLNSHQSVDGSLLKTFDDTLISMNLYPSSQMSSLAVLEYCSTEGKISLVHCIFLENTDFYLVGFGIDCTCGRLSRSLTSSILLLPFLA